MKILLVNAYQDNDEGFKQFIAFRYIVQKIFFEQLIIVDIETEFIIRTLNNLDDILFETNSSTYISTANGKFFDSFEMIFVSGHSAIRPWSHLNKSVLTLMRMCLKVKKPLFVTSFAMESLVFLCATNFDRNINVINGHNGGKLQDLCSFAKSQNQNFSINDYFLDNVTGDLYIFNTEKQEWVAKVNVGLHNHKAAQEFQTLGKYLLKAPHYRPKEFYNQQYEEVFVAKKTEAVCYIKKQYLLHYLFQGIPTPKFLVKLKSTWDVHTFSFTNPENTFTTLAESDRGPMVIEISDNIVGMQFEVDTQYSNSVLPVKNWILDKLHKISEGRIIYKSIVGYVTFTKSGPLYELEQQKKQKPNRELSIKMLGQGQNAQKTRSLSQLNQDNVQDQLSNNNYNQQLHKFKNSGMAARPDMIGLIVENNNIQDRKIKVNNQKLLLQQQFDKNFNMLHNFNQTNYNTSGLFLNKNAKQMNNNSFKQLQFKIKSRKAQSSRCSPSRLSVKDNDNSNGIDEDHNFWNNLNDEDSINNFDKEQEALLSQINFTQQLVRKQLHPNLSKNCLYEQKLWVPGKYQKSNNDKLSDIKKFNTADLIKTSSRKNSSSHQNVFSTAIFDDQKNSQASIFSSEPYQTQQEVLQKFEKQQMAKIIGSKIFKTGLNNNNKSQIKSNNGTNQNRINNFVESLIENQSSFPQQYSSLKPNFREIDKNKWLMKQDFKI